MKDDTFFAVLACGIMFLIGVAFVWLIYWLVKIIITGFLTVL